MAQPPRDARLGRRLFVFRVATVGAVTAAAGAASAATNSAPAPAETLAPDGVTRIVTDNDPRDAPGYGRGYYRRPYGTGITDNDPNDGPGNGRGYRPPPQYYGPRRGVTDTDPRDSPGYGRGWR